MWQNENCNNGKPACKRGYVYKCLPLIVSYFYYAPAGKPACKKGYVYKCPAKILYLRQDKILDLKSNEQR
jgi:hypothetical protein